MVGFGGGADRRDLSVEDEVRAALDAMGTERTGQFLRYLLETATRGEHDKLSEHALGATFFDRPADWDPGVDPVVRHEATRLRRRLARYYESDGSAADVRIHLPSGSYVPVLVRGGEAGFSEEPTEEEEALPELSPRWYIAAAVLIVASLVSGWLYWHAFRAGTR
jgi:hypothetical protein